MLLKFSGFLILLVLFLQQTQPQTIKRRCLLPLEQGKGKAILRNWYFNSTTSKCQKFVFFGGEKNGNNFQTKARCNKICLANLPMTIGNDPMEV
ncbi:PI-actitoxin-Afv2a [Drosophila pseudoobscura]|uniref:PI-actitoxin-Afv2a n=1 Tax=Drosophila pseudoobscura pseudoobscura TaxID=46245 RepID=A0A6I8V337_DROPS|nr:PI-actitoxin-Afv2a [Drosophila pseudoobscura]